MPILRQLPASIKPKTIRYDQKTDPFHGTRPGPGHPGHPVAAAAGRSGEEPYNEETGPCMILDNTCVMKYNHDKVLIELAN